MGDAARGWAIRVPASSANLGAGFDVLGMALTLHAEVGVGDVPDGARRVDAHHPADVAFRRLGGSGHLWVRSPIPAGRGLGFSGAVRVGGAAAAVVQRDGVGALDHDGGRAEVLALTAELEHHADNAAASIYGGIVAAAGTMITRVPLAFDPAVVVWVPESTTTSTDHSRSRLPDTVSRADAVFNLGRVATFVAACANGDHAALRLATEDRLHQPHRLAQVPASAAALEAALAAGAWAAWLSGSGPTVAAMCEIARAEELVAAMPADGHVKLLRIDHEGVTVTAPLGT
jgi:homoserine kinase